MNIGALQVKTGYSLLNSIINIKKLVALAKNYNYSFLAITDELNMFGVMEFYKECKKNNIKPIIGVELHILEYVVLLYAKNMMGYKNLIKLTTINSERDLLIEDLIKYKDNLVMIMPKDKYNDEIFLIYEDSYIGYSKDYERESIPTNKRVFINDIRYLYPDDDIYLDYLLMIKEGKIIGEYEFGKYKDKYLLNRKDIEKLIDNNTLSNIEDIGNKCNLEFEYSNGVLPKYDSNIDSSSYLRSLCLKGLNKRLNNEVNEIYENRLNKELDVINKMGFNDYFLIVYDYVLYAKKNNILVGPGRGSAAGSLVSYCLGITDVDPIKYNLLFERFLNSERITMPDIDIDFDAEKRQNVIDYVIKRYDNDNMKKVAGIITFNTFGAKQIIRDMGKILNITSSLIDQLAKLCNKNLMDSYKENEQLRKLIDNNEEIKELYKIALRLEGLPRHISMHAAGVVISDRSIDEIIPLYKNQFDMYVTGYTKDYIEELGLLKMDFLGISNLTFINNVINNIRDTLGLNITFGNIPMNDSLALEIFSKGDTQDIFQFESLGMINFLKELKVDSFNDIVNAISLYRPGPMDNIGEFIKRKDGKKIDYIHKDLENILKDTYGIIVYQEQIMEITCKMAGYTLGEADILRRAISKKKEDILLNEREKFTKGALSRGYSQEIIDRVYDMILKFADYGFNKSHAVSYSIIAYKMAYLKAHFYPYYILEVLNNNINNEEKSNMYIALLRSKKIELLNPDINISINKYLIQDKKIISPLSIIKNIGNNISNMIIFERNNGKFLSFIDFAKRMYSKSINREVLESLIYASCFDEMGYNKKTLISNLDNILNYVDIIRDSDIAIEEPLIDSFMEYDKDYLIKEELRIFGYYLSSHPVSSYKDNMSINTIMLDKYIDKYVDIILEVNNIKEILTKKNDTMSFIKASDEFKSINLTLFPDTYKKYNKIDKYNIIKVFGKVEKRLDKYQIIVSKLDILK